MTRAWDQAVTSASSGASLGAPVNSMRSTVMSSFCPKAWACCTMAAADWLLMVRARSKPKSSFCGVHGFDDAVGEEGETVAGLEGDDARRRIDDIRGAQRKGAFEIELLAIEIGRKMAGVGDVHRAVGAQFGNEAGGEVASGAADEALVEHGEHCDGVEAFVGAGANGADEHGDEHGRAHAFAGDVADNDQQAAVGF